MLQGGNDTFLDHVHQYENKFDGTQYLPWNTRTYRLEQKVNIQYSFLCETIISIDINFIFKSHFHIFQTTNFFSLIDLI